MKTKELKNDKTKAVSQAIQDKMSKILYTFRSQEDTVFFAEVLSQCRIQITNNTETASVGLNKKGDITLRVNPEFFNTLTLAQAIAVLTHEMLHITHNHLLRFKTINSIEHKFLNYALDCSINQHINNLPEWCVTLQSFNKLVGINAESQKTSDYYYSLMQDSLNELKSKVKTIISEMIDSHFDESGMSEAEKQEKINQFYEQVCKNCSDKRVLMPKHFTDIVEAAAKINWKNIFKTFLAQQINSISQLKTWNRPHKKYGNLCSVSKPDKKFDINFFIDTSGSISEKTLSEFVAIYQTLDRKYKNNLNFYYFHTSIYKHTKDFNTFYFDNLESGGTDLTEVSEYINKSKLKSVNIVFTDGYFSIPPKHKRSIYLLFNDGVVDNIDLYHKIIQIN